MKWYKIYNSEKDALAEVQEGKVSRVFAGSGFVCLTRQGSQFFGFDDKCPHQGASMVQAECIDGVAICPLHRFRFDLSTGHGNEGFILPVYPVEIRDDGVYLGRSESPWYLFD